MPRYSKSSFDKLSTCDERLQLVGNIAIEHWDHTVLFGHRPEAEQNAAVAAGFSTTPFPHSKHNRLPSRAMDLAPWYPDVPNGGIDWRTDAELMVAMKRGDLATAKAILENIKRWLAFSGFIRGIAAAKGIRLRSGADWDSDQRFNDHSLIDLPHFELIDP